MTDTTITLAEATENAAEAAAGRQHLAALDAPAYPVEAEPPRLTLRQRWDAFLLRRRVAKLRRALAGEYDRMAALPYRADQKKHVEQVRYGQRLAEIDRWRDKEKAECKASIARLKAEISLAGEQP